MKFTTTILSLLASLAVAQAAETVVVSSFSTSGNGDPKGEFQTGNILFAINKDYCNAEYVGPAISEKFTGACGTSVSETEFKEAPWEFTLEGYTANDLNVNITIWYPKDGATLHGAGTINVECQRFEDNTMDCDAAETTITLQ